jgi:hypothetical protein
MANPIPPAHTDSVLILTEDIKEGAYVYATDGTNTERYVVGPVTLIEYTDLDTNTTIWYHEVAHNLGTIPTAVAWRDSKILFNDVEATESTYGLSGNILTTEYGQLSFNNTREIVTEVWSQTVDNHISGITATPLREG